MKHDDNMNDWLEFRGLGHEEKPQSKPATATVNDYQVGGTHYKDLTVQPWDAMEAWMSPEEFQGYLRGNALKYLARVGRKAGLLEDFKKAQHYLEKLIEVLEKRGVRE